MNAGFSSNSLSTALQDHFDRLSKSFRESMDILVKDPLMKCFAESSESQKYMFDRIEEILSDTVLQVSNGLKIPPQSVQSDPGRGNHGGQIFEMQKVICRLEEKNKKLAEDLARDREQLEACMKELDKEKKDKKNMEGRFEKFEEVRQHEEQKAAELEEILANLRAKIHPLEHQLEDKKKETERLAGRNGELEQQVRKLEFAYKETQDQLLRENRQLLEENDLISKKCKDLQKLHNGNGGAKISDSGSRIQVLEETIRQLKDSNDALARKSDEMEFAKRNIEDHMLALKTEINDTNELNTLLKREKHGLEIELIELNNKLAEITIKANRQKEESEKTNVDSEYLRAEFDKLEKLFKAEKRKSSNLERELDQVKYSHDMLHKNTNEEIRSLRDHNTGLKNENRSLQEKLESQFREMQQRIDEERKANIKNSKRVKELENEEENLRLQVESLLQKVDFYKQQLQAGFQGINPQHLYSENNERKSHSLQESMREAPDRPRNNFESFSSFHHKVKEITLGIKEDKEPSIMRLENSYKRAPSFRDVKAENEALKAKLSTVLIQLSHLKEVFKLEQSNLKQELAILKNHLFKALELVATRVRMNVRRAVVERPAPYIGERPCKSYLSPSSKYLPRDYDFRDSSGLKRTPSASDRNFLVNRFSHADERSRSKAFSPGLLESPLRRHKYGYEDKLAGAALSSPKRPPHGERQDDFNKENNPLADNKRRPDRHTPLSSLHSHKDINIHTIEQESQEILQRLHMRRNRGAKELTRQPSNDRIDRYSYLNTPHSENYSRHANNFY
jgi:myosin heavy subunit